MCMIICPVYILERGYGSVFLKGIIGKHRLANMPIKTEIHRCHGEVDI